MKRHRAASVVALVLLSAVVAPAMATNGLAQFSLRPPTVSAAPGENVSLAVDLRSSPQIASGAYKAGFVLQFDPTALKATNVTQGPFMSGRRETTVKVNLSRANNERGFLIYELVRDPPAGGVAGYEQFATVTFAVREDAPEGTYDVTFYRTLVLLTDGNYQQVTTVGASVTVNRTATPVPTAGTADVSPTPRPGPTPTAGPPARDGSGGSLVGVLALLGTFGLLAGVLVLVRRA